jgi:hypothetical protein
MTEAEWLTATDPTPMLEFLKGKASDRKLRLLAVACCRRVWGLLADQRCRKGVDVAERYADGRATEDELNEAADAAYQAADDVRVDAYTIPHDAAWEATHDAVWQAAHAIDNEAFVFADAHFLHEPVRHTGDKEQAILLRDIFGNPFRRATLNPSWLTSTVVTFATGIYEEKAFDRMPILADALQAAGCDDEVILDHCRQAGEHVRGCWVVDSVLGKR